MKVQDKQSIKGKPQNLKKRYRIAIVCGIFLFCTAGSAFALVEYPAYTAKYHSELALAQGGIQHLRTAMTLLESLPHNPLDAATVEHAQHEFASALPVFVRLNSDLKSFPGISTLIPVYGARLSAALHVLPLAIEVSQAGIITCSTLDLLIARLHDPLNTKQQGLTTADQTFIEQNFQQIKTKLHLIIYQVNHLQPGDVQLDPRLGKLITLFHENMPLLQVWLDAVDKLLPVVPILLGIGTPANYLIEVLDSTELRPGGGFIGNYGIATFSGGRLAAAHITDVDLLDRPFEAAGHVIPFPSVYKWFHVVPSWSLRDSNLDADFPTAARYGEMNYMREGGNVPLQGVIAITPVLIEHALEITGPIDIPEYHETVTAQNLIARIHYHQLGPAGEGPDSVPSPDGHSSLRKRFTALLAEHFLFHVRHLPPANLAKFLQLLVSSLHSKDIQIYLNSSIAEGILQKLHLDSAIQSSTSDGLMLVDTNVAGNKANGFFTNTLNDQVTIDMSGNAVHHTTISYAWKIPGPVYGSHTYQDYLRVYVPLGSTLQAQGGWLPLGTSEAFNHEVWAGYFTLSFGQTQTISLEWSVPAAAKQIGRGWRYQDLIQRQAGIQWQLSLQVTLPSCALMNKKWGGLASHTNQVAALSQPLNGNLDVGIDYAC